MQGFKFRLQRVLQWQVKVRHIEEEGVRRCRLAVTEGEERIAELQAKSLAAEQELLGHRTIASSDLVAFSSFHASAVLKLRDLEIEQQALIKAVDDQMRRLIAARRQVQQLETLRDRSLVEYNLNVNRELEGLALESYLSRRISTAQQNESTH
jgi:hypothetical protein